MSAGFLPNGKQQFIDINGAPLVGGFVYFYFPNTLIFNNTWKDSAQSILNTNPVVLDSRGQAVIFGSGAYRQILKDSLGNTIWDEIVFGSPSGGTGGFIPVEAFGAVGDAYQISDGAVTSGLKILTSPSNGFISFAGSKTVVVNGASAIVNGLPTDLVTTAVFVSVGQLTLTGAAGNTVSGATVSIGTDNTSAIQSALNSTVAPNLMLMQGIYLCGSGLILPGRKNLYGSGGGRNAGLLLAGSAYSLQANISTDPIAGTGGTATITSATQSTNTATYNLSASSPSWLQVGSIVQTTGLLAAGYNFTGKVLSVGANSFTMIVPTSGLGNSSQGGMLTSMAGKKYGVCSNTTNTDATNVWNLNFIACNPNTTVPWGVLWPNTGGNNGMWDFNFFNCLFIGWVGRHIMWCNGCAYINCDYLGVWSGDAFTIPTGLSFTPTIQKITDLDCEFSQLQTAFGSLHYESNQGGNPASLSGWKFSGGTLENGYGLGDFTGIAYDIRPSHVERLSAAIASLTINVPNGSNGIVGPIDLDVTTPQLGFISTAFGNLGTSSWIWLGGNVGTKEVDTAALNAANAAIGGATITSTTGIIMNSSTTIQRGIDIEISPTGASNFGGILSLTGAGTLNTALELSAVGGGTNVSLNLQHGIIISGGATVLPTGDPHVVGQWWNNAGVVTVSAG